MIDRLYTYIVGGMRVAPSEFWGMTIKEANLAIKGDRIRQENDFMIDVYSHINASFFLLGALQNKLHDKPTVCNLVWTQGYYYGFQDP